MKYFGQYLVSKEIITAEILVDTLIEQLTALPPTVALVRKKNLLSSAALLSVFAHQTERNLEFKQACLDLKVWTSDIEDAVKKERESLREPLGQLLLKKGAIDLQTVTKALDEFLSRAEAPSDSVSKREQPPMTTVSVQTAAAEKVDPVLSDEFSAFLSDEKLQSLKTSFTALSASAVGNEVANGVLKQLFSELRSLRGILKFVRLTKTESLISMLEALVFKAIEMSMQKDFHLFSGLSEMGHLSVELLEGLKTALIERRSEAQWLESPEWSAKMEALLKRLDQVSEQEKMRREN